MLAVGVGDQDEPPGGLARMPLFTAAPLPLLYGWRTTRAPAAAAVAAVVIGRAIVDDEDLEPARGRREVADDRADRRGLVERGDHDRGLRGVRGISHEP